MLSWRMFTDPYSIATIVLPLVVLLWLCGRALFAGRLGRGPRCGACKHETAVPPGDRCPECGMLYTDAGITTRRLRRLGAFPMVLVLAAWTVFAGAMAFRSDLWLKSRAESAVDEELSEALSTGRFSVYRFDVKMSPNGQFLGLERRSPTASLSLSLRGQFQTSGDEVSKFDADLVVEPTGKPPLFLTISFPSVTWSTAHHELGKSQGEPVTRDSLRHMFLLGDSGFSPQQIQSQVEHLWTMLDKLASHPVTLHEHAFRVSDWEVPQGPRGFGNGSWVLSRSSRGEKFANHTLRLADSRKSGATSPLTANFIYTASTNPTDTALPLLPPLTASRIQIADNSKMLVSIGHTPRGWFVESPRSTAVAESNAFGFEAKDWRALLSTVRADLGPIALNDLALICQAVIDPMAADAFHVLSPDPSIERDTHPLRLQTSLGSSYISTGLDSTLARAELLRAAKARATVIALGASMTAWLLGLITLLLTRPRLPRPEAG